jgi:hypothetical protein
VLLASIDLTAPTASGVGHFCGVLAQPHQVGGEFLGVGAMLRLVERLNGHERLMVGVDRLCLHEQCEMLAEQPIAVGLGSHARLPHSQL